MNQIGRIKEDEMKKLKELVLPAVFCVMCGMVGVMIVWGIQSALMSYNTVVMRANTAFNAVNNIKINPDGTLSAVNLPVAQQVEPEAEKKDKAANKK